jgi:hypothetical protein
MYCGSFIVLPDSNPPERRSALPLVQILQDLCYHQSTTKADPDDVWWLRKATKDDWFEYYEMLFVYIDDILALSN